MSFPIISLAVSRGFEPLGIKVLSDYNENDYQEIGLLGSDLNGVIEWRSYLK